MSKPNIFKFSNYRIFLNELFLAKKNDLVKYSYRQLARDAGYITSDHFQRIVKGKRNLTKDGVERFSRVFSLNETEKRFLINLVGFNDAKKHEVKKAYLSKLTEFQQFKQFNPYVEEKFKYLSHWYYVAIRELSLLPSFNEDPRWIASQLSPKVSLQEIMQAIIDLQNLGLLKRDINGQLVTGQERKIDMGQEVYSTIAINYHQEMIEQAKSSIERFDRSLRNISCVTFPFTIKNVEQIKEMIVDFQQKVMNVCQQEKNADSIYQFNLQLFPLTLVHDKTRA
ncbi:MAG: TIGR02147 family protein [Halobacteriovoraceae bacterium]|nr:TIGR02147 family protein [Halobacteriovoraceae bacterium]